MRPHIFCRQTELGTVGSRPASVVVTSTQASGPTDLAVVGSPVPRAMTCHAATGQPMPSAVGVRA